MRDRHKTFKRVVVGAVVVIAAGLFLGGGSEEVAGYVERSRALLTEASSSFLTAHGDDHQANSIGPVPDDPPASTGSLTSVARQGAGRDGDGPERAPNDVMDSPHAQRQNTNVGVVLSPTSSASSAVIDHGQGRDGGIAARLDPPLEPTPAPDLSAVAGKAAAEEAHLCQLEVTARKSEVDLQRDLLATEVERLKQESTALRQAKAAAESALSRTDARAREERELMAVIQQELFRATDEIERLKKHSTALAEKAAARERALRRELQASQRQVQHLRAGLAQTGSLARGADKIQSGYSMSSQLEDRPHVGQ
jgi:hypothetical protein